MLALDTRDLHTKHSSTTYFQDGRQAHKRPARQKQKPKVERKTYVVPPPPQAKAGAVPSRVKNTKAAATSSTAATTVSTREKHGKPAGKKNRSVPQEAIVVTKSQLQEILEAARLQLSNSSEEGNNDGSNTKDNEKRSSPRTRNIGDAASPSSNNCAPPIQHLLTLPVSHAEIRVVSPQSNQDGPDSSRSFSPPSAADVGNEETAHTSSHKMSLLEQKRLQWARERAQLQVATDWSPWGKPGCGAPLSVGSGSRKPGSDWSIASKHSNGPTQSVRITGAGDSGRTVLPPLPQTMPAPKKTPLALRSSLSLAYTPGADAVYNNKEEEKRKWLEELDRQREEQRLRRLLDQDSLQTNTQVAVDRISISSPNHSPLRAPVTLPTSFSPTLPPVAEHGFDAFSAPMACTETVTIQRSFLRGANVPLDAETRADLERKRQKQREVQLEIEAQLEDKQRRLKEEKQRQRDEELREEERIAKEQQMLEQQKRMEEARIKAKTQGLPVVPSPEHAPNVTQDMTPTDSVDETSFQHTSSDQKEKDVHPPPPCVVSVDAGDDHGSGRSESSVQSPQSSMTIRVASPYTRNRILTPTKYRGSDASNYPPRECGTQTDSSLPRKKDVGIDAETAAQEREMRRNNDRRNNRNDPKNGKKKDGEEKFMHRPKWGSHQTEKAYLKQSEKDPKYLTRRQLHEMRRKRLEEEAAMQCAMPQIGRTRSSAKHQRQLLANEDLSPITATPNRRSPSPAGMHRYSSLESPFLDDHATESAVRRQRRQWDSPSTDEIPNFYTQPHQLPARRNSQSQSSRSVRTATPDQYSPVKGNHDINLTAPLTAQTQPLSSWNSASELRILSPPVPSLRHRVQSMENVHLAGVDLNSGERVLTALSYRTGLEDSSDSIHSSRRGTSSDEIRGRMARKSITSACSSYSAAKDTLPYMRSTVTLNSSTSIPSAGSQRHHRPHNSKILEQLSAIRQGLIKKQQEMEHFLHPNEDGMRELQS